MVIQRKKVIGNTEIAKYEKKMNYTKNEIQIEITKKLHRNIQYFKREYGDTSRQIQCINRSR